MANQSTALLFAATMLVLSPSALMRGITPPAAAQAATAKQFSFPIKQRKLGAADNTVRVVKGDTVELVFTGDEPAELHLHGYEIKLDLKANEPGKMRFTAMIAGRFPLEVHRFGTGTNPGRSHINRPLLYVEVLPQ
jgi:FtsP/CotA-like multicopper oxidase with cupredoxin domain